MVRLYILLVATISLSAHAQERHYPSLIPISGRVLNAVTGAPIPGAIVHYRGAGNVSDGAGTMTSPPTMQGEIIAGPDGTYTTPPLPSFGDFDIRASAPGFFRAKQYLQALPKDLVGDLPPPPPIPGYKARPSTNYPSTFRLYPDSLSLKPMSGTALAALAAPAGYWVANRTLTSPQFSADGSHLGFIARDVLATRDPANTQTCKLWSYDLSSGAMIGAELPGSPIVVRPPKYELPPAFCSRDSVTEARSYYSIGFSVTWAGDVLYLLSSHLPDSQANKANPSLPPVVDVFVLRGSRLDRAPLETLPPVITAAIADLTKPHSLRKSSAPPSHTRFVLQFHEVEGRGCCSTVVAVSYRPSSRRTIAQAGPEFTQLSDTRRGLFFFTRPARSPYPNQFESLVEFNLNTGRTRTFDLPVANREPQLLVFYPLPNGATRIAYTMRGDCDRSASDYSQPFQPDGVLGQTPNQFSVCFVTVPSSALR